MSSLLAFIAVGLLAVVPTLVSAASCPAGSSSSNGQAPCALCSPGFFQPNSGQTSCRAAQPGWFASGPKEGFGATSQTICQQGTYSPSSGSKSCTVCPPGSYCHGVGGVKPTPCPPGYFSATPGAGQMCTPCPPGQFQANSGATSCCSCCSGFYNDQKSQPHCFKCPVKGASSPIGATSTKQCSSKPNGGFDTCTQSSKGTCPPAGKPSQAAVAPRRKVRRESCPLGHKSCPLFGSTSGRGFLKGYECVDVKNDLESCGGCALNDSPAGQPSADGGRDCSAIPFVSDVTCSNGKCVVNKCRNGYVPAPDGASCVASLNIPTATFREQL